jgi:hypothetical protein
MRRQRRLSDVCWFSAYFVKPATGFAIRIGAIKPLTGWRMAQPVSTAQEIPGALRPARKAASAIAMAGAGFGIVLGLGAAVLWFHYGTAVFFETIASGLSACF